MELRELGSVGLRAWDVAVGAAGVKAAELDGCSTDVVRRRKPWRCAEVEGGAAAAACGAVPLWMEGVVLFFSRLVLAWSVITWRRLCA